MCGIYAYCSKDSRHDGHPELIKHRGPDETKNITIETREGDNIWLTFHRLFINGTSTEASQPFNYNDKVYLLVNGEIYNHVELEQDVAETTRAFKTTGSKSDCAVVLDLYLKYNSIEKTINMLDGEFAFCLIDLRCRKMFLGRDHVGVRSLYYRKSPGVFAVCSELKGLMSDCTVVGASHPVDQFPNRHYGIYDMDTEVLSFHPYETIFTGSPEPVMPIDEVNFKAKTKTIGELLDNAVKKRLMCDRKTKDGTPAIGAFLSGGFDSSIVAALAQEHLTDGPIHTFSIGFADAPDLLAARSVAEHIGSIHHEYVVTEDYMLGLLPQVIYSIESYDITSVRASTFMYALSKLIHENHPEIVVLLSGEGPDEASGSYMYFYNAPNHQEFFDETMRLLDDLRYFDCLRGDKTTAGNSLEIRVPFLDKEFLNYYMLSVHPANKLIPKGPDGKGGMEKFILRSCFSQWKNRKGGLILPEQIIWRPKEAMSDGVSRIGEGRSWFQIIQAHIASKKGLGLGLGLTTHSHPFSPVQTSGIALEREWYRDVFNFYYPGCSHVVPYYWLPRWSYTADGKPVEDPSARVLSVYHQI
jgi:asparagine synthase (glutamine-hydrolysing)